MTRTWTRGLAVVLTVSLAACGGAPDRPVPAAPVPAPVSPAPPPPAHARRVVFLGDSLTAGLGLPIEQAFPSLVAQRLAARGTGWEVVNAGVSGDTSAGAMRRLAWVLDGGADVLIVALGGNDALRGLPTEDLDKNLDAIVTEAQRRGTTVLLAGMEAPPNNGPEYTARFRRVYRDVAARRGIVLLPFLLDGVAGIERLNQADGIHPNQEGAVLVAGTVWRTLEPVIREVEKVSNE